MLCPMCNKGKEANENLKIGGLQICNECYQKYLDGLDRQKKPLEYFKDTTFVACPECHSNRIKIIQVETFAYRYSDVFKMERFDGIFPRSKSVCLDFKCDDCGASYTLMVESQDDCGVKAMWERIPD